MTPGATDGPFDSGGVPFEGRELTASSFAGDSGEADPAVIAALEALARDGSAAHVADLLTRLRGARVLVPVVAAPPGEPVQHHGGGGAHGHSHDGPGVHAHGDGGGPEHADTHDHEDAPSDGTEMATVTLTAPDGRRAMPVFTGVAALAAWDATARPSPTHVPDVARSAIEDGCDTLLVDLGSPHAAALPLTHVWALAQERAWHPPHEDPVVTAAVAALPAQVEGLLDARAEDGTDAYGPDVLRLVLLLGPGLAQEEVQRIVTAAGETLARDPEVRIRIDDLAVALRTG